VKTCPSCRRENAEDARFCSGCGTLLEPAPSVREERKVVTCLFCDLVGFTARAELMDPEDVRRLLQPYHARVRSELERHGGTVEKFIGDAVMAVFGAPVAHEDDPERAVRAALAIRDVLAEEGELEIRIGITTGEALIALGARPETGEGMASGDVVNTAARIQAAAAVGGILVDETTFRATERAIAYSEAEPVDAKGKSEPVAVWGALRAHARVGVERVGGAPLVGREQELTLLQETLTRVTRERSPQLVTLVGVPGIGKSRLVYELFRVVESGAFGLVYWRHGRSLPYGEGVTFWALAEMVKAQAGILESDSPEQASERLSRAVESVVSETEAGWVERHLRPLVGLEAEEAVTGDRRSEAFAAWRRFLEALAEERPLVLVFEDLHWADEALLEFVDYLVDWATGVPVLALCTTRPELLTQRHGWGGGKVNSSTILLSPLSDKETAVLVHALLGRSAIEADLQARLLEHAGGNPLYTEEFTRMLLERPAEVVVLPETVQGMIAARLDTLPREEKELLQDAAVVGKVFWLGALGRERWTLEERLHSLERKEFVSRQRRSSVAGEDEYVFRHTLVRDVAYEQIPKAGRAGKHRAAAEWIESLGRTEDHAELLAHHYLSALEFATSAGQAKAGLAERGAAALRNAGERAFALSAYDAAKRFFTAAADLAPAGSPERSRLLFQLGRTRYVGEGGGAEELEEACTALMASGDYATAAEAEVVLADLVYRRGEREQADTHLDRSLALVRDLEQSRAKASVLTTVARLRLIGGQDVIPLAQDALRMADEVGDDELRAHALDVVGLARAVSGDRGGLEDLEQSARIAAGANAPHEECRALNNLTAMLFMFGELSRSEAVSEEAVRVAERFGQATWIRWLRTAVISLRYARGDWDGALSSIDDSLEEVEAGSPHYTTSELLPLRGRMRLGRLEEQAAASDAERALAVARGVKDPQALYPALADCAWILVETGSPERAAPLVDEFIDALRGGVQIGHIAQSLPTLAFAAWEVQRGSALAQVLPSESPFPWVDAARAYAQGNPDLAAHVLAEIGYLPDEAYARLRAAEKLLAGDRNDEVEATLEHALVFWRSAGATRYVRQAEKLLADAGLEIPA
jgi:class 3 adenylate cyclase/tetratricopeptide (TPR) repeat protein